MIVPRDKLLGWTALVVVPSGALIGLVPSLLPPLALLLLLFVAAALIDLIRAERRLRGVSVQLPEVVRLGEHGEAALELLLKNPERRGGACLLALAWPPECPARVPILAVQLDPDQAASSVSFPCRPGARGRYRIGEYYLGTDSALGWWTVRRRRPASVELRVYPTLREEKRALASLFQQRQLAGSHAVRQVGMGREFEKLRDYAPGDSYENIHWKATARRGRPVTKVYRIERTQEVYVVLDASRLSSRPAPGGQPGETYLDRFINATLLLSLAVRQQGDLFGLVTFGSKAGVDHFVRAGSGLAFQQSCREALYGLRPADASPHYGEVASAIRLRLRRRCLLVFLTCLDDPFLAESLTGALEMIRRQHLVVVNTLAAEGVQPVFSGPDVRSRDDLCRRLAGHLSWQQFAQTRLTLQHRGVQTLVGRDGKFAPLLVQRYLQIKQRQLI